MTYSATDDLAASSRRGRRGIAGLGAPAHRKGGGAGADRRARDGQARREAEDVPDQPQGARLRDGSAGVRGVWRGAAERAATRRWSVRSGGARDRGRRRAARGPRPRLLDGCSQGDRRAGAHEEGRARRRGARRAEGAAAARRARRDRVVNPAPLACVDIGSNTTRLLVAAWDGSRLRELMTQRGYTRLGKVIRKSGAMPPQAIAAETDVVATQVRHARDLGAQDIRIVATAAIRHAPNRDDLV